MRKFAVTVVAVLLVAAPSFARPYCGAGKAECKAQGNPDQTTSVLVQLGKGNVGGAYDWRGDLSLVRLELSQPFSRWGTLLVGYNFLATRWDGYQSYRDTDEELFTVGARFYLR